MSLYIRIDDYPYGDRNLAIGPQRDCYKNECLKIVDIIEQYDVEYIWGVSPLLCNEDILSVFSNKMKNGSIVMHGFDHAFSLVNDWMHVTDCWQAGGEFGFYSEETIEKLYEYCDLILSKVKYNKRHFIPPFNCYNQEVLNVLDRHGVEFIHTCDQEVKKYGLDKLDHKGIKMVVSELGSTYDYIHKVRNHIGKSQITLHWCYDIMNVPNWEREYHNTFNLLHQANQVDPQVS